MRNVICLGLVVALAATGLAPGCGGTPEDDAGRAEVEVFVTIAPLAFFVERIGGEFVDVSVLVEPGQSPATYQPTMKEIDRLLRADVLFRTGVPFERALLERIEGMAGDLRIVDLRQGVTLRRMKAHRHAGEVSDAEDAGGAERAGEAQAEHDGDDSLGAPDPHIWLSPRIAKTMAGTVANALAQIAPQHADAFRANLRLLREDLDRLDAELSETLAPLRGRKLLVFHPAYGYFADAYSLDQVPVEVEGKEPSARGVDRLVAMARREGIRVIFVQPQFSQSSARMIARRIDGAVVPLDPLARDYLANLREMARQVDRTLGGDDGREAGR